VNLGPRRLRQLIGQVVRRTREHLRERDLMLYAAGLTFFAALGLVPLLLIGLRLGTAVLGADVMRETATALTQFTPSRLGVGDALRQFVDRGAEVGWWSVVVAIVPASLYSEGLVRALNRFEPDALRRAPTIRGRVLTAALIGTVGLGAVVLAGVVRPLATHSYGHGWPGRLLGILVAFVVAWIGFTALLCLLYRVFPARRLPAVPLIIGAAATSWLAGQTLGFLLVLRLAFGVGTAYGGSVAAGAAATVLFLLYLDNIALLGGYVLTRAVAEVGAGLNAKAPVGAPGLAAPLRADPAAGGDQAENSASIDPATVTDSNDVDHQLGI
jgi:membrane protein